MTTLAIDIGGTKLAAALIDSRLTLLERREVPPPASQTPAALAAALAALVAPLSARADRFAIASTGIIQDGILTAINPANLGGLAHFLCRRVYPTSRRCPVLPSMMLRPQHGRNIMCCRRKSARCSF